MKRRTALKGIAWSAPSAVVVTAAPAVATSLLESRIRFTNVTATEGKKPGVVYANVRVQVIDGPDTVRDLTLTITCAGQSKTFMWAQVAGWGNTEQVHVEFPGIETDTTVTFTATATGIEPISGAVHVKAAGWW